MESPRIVGPFEVLESLGAGGMGEVFKARDRRLNRFVALKFLPAGATPAARERFQREALAIAALSHPNICALFEIGDDQGRPYLVLELLEGETLRARLRRGPLAPEHLVDWGLQIAEALDAAHRRGVLHRDLKPDNIWVGQGGHLKVLDFGLARLDEAGSDDDQAQTLAVDQARALTSPGVTLGTIPYMSPEQARGEALDARSDLFSFGAVFYEMATGRAAFPARSTAALMAAILKEQPPPARQLRPELPPKLEEVAQRCLEKDPDLRYQSAADLRGEFKRLKLASSGATSASPVASGPEMAASPPVSTISSDSQIISGLLRRHWRWPALAAVILVAGAAAWWHWAPRAAAARPTLSFHQLTFDGHVLDAVISPDGKFLAHVDATPAGVSLHLLSVANGSDVQIVPPGPGCCQSPSFSNDGSSVYFVSNRALYSVPILGGALRTIADPACSGAAFSPDGTRIAFLTPPAAGTDLTVARPDGSEARVLHQSAAGTGYVSQCWGTPGQPTHAPAWSPDGRWVAVANAANTQIGHIELISTTDGHVLDLAPNTNFDAWDLSWLPEGSGLAFTASLPVSAVPQLWRVAYPGGQLTQLTNDLQGYASLSLAASGELALVHASPQYFIWSQAKAGGEFQQLAGGGANQDGANGLAWSPAGSVVSLRDLGGKLQFWSDNRPLAMDSVPLLASGPQIVPGGQIVFMGNGQSATTIWRANPDGTGLTALVHPAPGAQAITPVIVNAGHDLAYLYLDAKDNQTVWTVPLVGGTPRQIWSGYIFADGLAASHDGTRIFAIRQGSNNFHQPVILRLDGTVTPVPMDFKTMPPPYGWTPDDKAITYVVNQGTTDNIWAFPLAGGKPYALTHFTDLNIAAYAWSRDGRLAISRGTQNSDAVVATGLVAHAHP